MKKYILPILLALPALIFGQNAALTSAMLGKMEARHIGPAVTGGRITAIDGVNSDPRILYVGTGGGGIWKTTNGGSQFKPVFDKQPQSIGCIAVDQKHPFSLCQFVAKNCCHKTVKKSILNKCLNN